MLDAQDFSRLRALEQAHLKLAREDSLAFCSYVLRDEETGDRIMHSRSHETWHRMLDAHRRAVIWGHVECGKTFSVSVGRVLFELGKNPSLRVAVVSNTDGMSQKICRVMGKYIEGSPQIKEVFPDLKRDKSAPWTAHQITVVRPTRSRDPSIQTCGVHGNILGARLDLVVLDDVVDYENSVSPVLRQDLIHWWHSTLEGRLTRNARVWVLGMVWDAEDLLHTLAKNPVYVSMRSPVVDENGPTWPSRWPQDRIDEKALAMGPLEAERQLYCREVSRTEARFRPEWIRKCLDRGEGRDLLHALPVIPPGCRVVTGVDLGVRDHHTSALTVLFTILVHPNEDREVIGIESGKWHGDEIVSRIIEVHRRFGSLVVVENNAAQDFIVQFTRARSAVPIRPFNTTAHAIRHPEFGLETLGAEMAGAKWIIPCRKGLGAPEVQRWLTDLLTYQPGAHAGDHLMASWFAREGARSMGRPAPMAPVAKTAARGGGF